MSDKINVLEKIMGAKILADLDAIKRKKIQLSCRKCHEFLRLDQVEVMSKVDSDSMSQDLYCPACFDKVIAIFERH